MRFVVGLLALTLAVVTGWLALVTAGPAFTVVAFPPPPGQMRGLVFTLAMVVITLGCLWIAARSVGWLGPRGTPRNE